MTESNPLTKKQLSSYIRRAEAAANEIHDVSASFGERVNEIIELICKGKSNRDISDSLFISLQTVKDHVHRIYLKTGVKNRVQLTNLIRGLYR